MWSVVGWGGGEHTPSAQLSPRAKTWSQPYKNVNWNMGVWTSNKRGEQRRRRKVKATCKKGESDRRMPG